MCAHHTDWLSEGGASLLGGVRALPLARASSGK